MNKIKTFLNNADVSRFRFWVQIFSFILFVYGGYWGITVAQNLPIFACPYNHATGGTCFLISLQHQLHTSWDNLFSARGLALLTGFGTFLLFFFFLNKAWCGFICPVGTLQDWITKFRKSIGIRFSRYEDSTFKYLKIVKYLFLVWLLLVPLAIANSFFGLPHMSHDWFPPFCTICPARVIMPLFTGDLSQLVIDFRSVPTLIMTTLGVLAAVLFFVGSFVKKRFFCLFCPMSALQYLFSKIAFLRLNKYGDKCTKCGNCYRVCDVGIKEIADDVTSKNIVMDDCMMCFKCVEACPEEGCLEVAMFKLPILKATEDGFFKRYGSAEQEEKEDEQK
jgi:polyferredoxin